MVDYSELHEESAAYLPTPEEIQRMKRLIRAENDSRKQGKAFQPPVEDDCNAELEAEADRAARRFG